MDTYTTIHCHSDDSLLDSCTKFKDYIELAKRDGCSALATTEHGLPRGWMTKWKACRDAGIKPLLGVEIYLTEQIENPVRDNYHTVLIAKNKDGLAEIFRLIELSTRQDHFYYTNRITFDEFLRISDNVIKTSACLASPLCRLDDSHPYYMRLARAYDYLEVQPHVAQEQTEYNRRLLFLSEEIGVPLIAGTDTHNSSPYKDECRKLLIKSKHRGKSYDNEDELDLNWRTYDVLLDEFKRQGALPEQKILDAIENTNRLAESVEEIDIDTSIKYPVLYGSPEQDVIECEKAVERMFQEKLDTGIIPREQEQAFRDAIDEEMRVFKKLNMAAFMLSMSEILNWCHEHRIATGTARGSVGGSCVAYVLGIIDLNPIQWNTVFSRFCNEDRVEIGD